MTPRPACTGQTRDEADPAPTWGQSGAALGIILIFTLYVYCFAVFVHVVGDYDPSNAEIDGYVSRITDFRLGTLPRDPYRPLLYPALGALIAGRHGDSFSGGQMVSVAGAALSLLLTWLLGVRLAGPRVALFAVMVVGLSVDWLMAAVRVASDGPFLALNLLALWAAWRLAERPGVLRAGVAGLSLGAAWSLRYPAVLVVLVWAGLAWQTERSRRWSWLVAVLAGLLAALPQMVANGVAWGDPFYNENYRNLALFHFGNGDWDYFMTVERATFWAACWREPWMLVTNAGRSLVNLAVSTVPAFFGGGWPGALLAGFAVWGIGLGRGRATGPGRVVWLFVPGYAAAIVCTFYVWPRILLPTLPFWAIGAGLALSAVAARFGGRRAPGFVLLAVVAVLAWRVGPAVTAFADAHPLPELTAARALQQARGKRIAVAGTANTVGRLLNCDYSVVPAATRAELAAPDPYWQRVYAWLNSARPRFIVVGSRSLGLRPAAWWQGTLPARLRGLETHLLAPGVRVYRVGAPWY